MIAFSIWSFNVYRYGIFYLISFLIGYVFLWYIGKVAKKQKNSFLQKHPKVLLILTENLDDLMLALVLWVLIGGRLGDVFIYNFWYYLQNPGEILAIWHGGMSFIGGIIGVLIALLTVKYFHKLSRKDIFLIFDIILLVVPVGIILGRLWNYLNQELYGVVLNPEIPWKIISTLQTIGVAHIYPRVDTLVRWNTNLFSLILEGVFIWITLLSIGRKQYKRNTRKIGKITLLFLILYSVIRFALEYIRQDSQAEFVWLFTITQWRMIAIWIGIVVALLLKKNLQSTRKEQ